MAAGKFALVPFAISGATTTVDLVECVPADDKSITLLGFMVGQKSEITEAQEEVLDLRLTRFLGGTPTSGSGGSTPTLFLPDGTDTALSATFEVVNTTIATLSGGATQEVRFPWQVRNTPFEYWFPREELCPLIRQTDTGLLRLSTAPADAIDIWGWLAVREG